MEKAERAHLNEFPEEEQAQLTAENKTYYYSKFDLFDEAQNFSLVKYRIFKRNLVKALGRHYDISYGEL